VLVALTLAAHGVVQAQGAPAAVPSFAELEAAGATIGEIRVVSQDIFDTTDPKEDYLLFRWANALHIKTRPSVIRDALLFKSGDAVSVRAIEETERLLLGRNSYLYEVHFRPMASRSPNETCWAPARPSAWAISTMSIAPATSFWSPTTAPSAPGPR
jgi:hypothetical protein